MRTRKQIRMDIACHRAIPDTDAVEFVKRTLYPVPPPSGGFLQLCIEYARHGDISRVLFAMTGTPLKGCATLYSNNGSLDAFQNPTNDYRLDIQPYATVNPRRTQDAVTIALFLQVARLHAGRVGYRNEDAFRY